MKQSVMIVHRCVLKCVRYRDLISWIDLDVLIIFKILSHLDLFIFFCIFVRLWTFFTLPFHWLILSCFQYHKPLCMRVCVCMRLVSVSAKSKYFSMMALVNERCMATTAKWGGGKVTATDRNDQHFEAKKPPTSVEPRKKRWKKTTIGRISTATATK